MNIYTYFEKAFKRYPEKTALFADNTGYTYHRMAAEAGRIATALLPLSNRFTGLLAHRSFTAFAGILGILQSGKGYVPLNPKFPAERLAMMIEQARLDTLVAEHRYLPLLEAVLTNSATKMKLVFPEGFPPSVPEGLKRHEIVIPPAHPTRRGTHTESSADRYAYMLFTSGSTGKPKGVPIRHSNVQAYVDNINRKYSFVKEDRFSNTFDLTFDLSVHDMFVCWSNAAALYCIPEKALMAPSKFLKKHEITCWFSVPSLAGVMNRLRMLRPASFPKLRYSLFCGEALQESLAARWQEAAPHSRLVNIYGPTEATIGITAYEYTPDKKKSYNGILPIGKLFPGNAMKIADDLLNDVEPGMPGELLLSGSQVTDQYWQAPEKTKAAFVEHEGVRWYKTGDRVKEDNEGDLLFIGRKDFQVKIQGYRVELSEIDHVVSAFLNNDNVRTIALTGENGISRLISCVAEVPENAQNRIFAVIKRCEETLPAYMVPESVLFFDRFPKNQNGKTDMKTLQQWAEKRYNEE